MKKGGNGGPRRHPLPASAELDWEASGGEDNVRFGRQSAAGAGRIEPLRGEQRPALFFREGLVGSLEGSIWWEGQGLSQKLFWE